jgi:hypothetical protein
MIAVDWSHTKGLTIYNGSETKVEDRKSLLKRLAGESNTGVKSIRSLTPANSGADGESSGLIKSSPSFNSSAPLVILEQGCPLSLIYDILKTGSQVKVISNQATKDYRVEHNIEKTDENDSKIIYELANNGVKLTPVNLDDKEIQLLELYQRYKRYQKARVAMVNMRKAYLRQFGDGESTSQIQSMVQLKPSPHDGTLAYDIGIDALKASENSCLKKIVKMTPPIPDNLKIRGLGPRLWAGIYITANPANFPTLSRYLRYCGLVDKKQLGTRWNRHACMLYHLLAFETMRLRAERFRSTYDHCKEDIASNHPEYTKSHIHNGALNRTATFLAKEIWRSGQIPE